MPLLTNDLWGGDGNSFARVPLCLKCHFPRSGSSGSWVIGFDAEGHVGEHWQTSCKCHTAAIAVVLGLVVGEPVSIVLLSSCGRCHTAQPRSGTRQEFRIEALSAPYQGFWQATYSTRRIFSIFRPFANSSTNLSKYLTCWVNGFSISSIR